MDTSRTSGSPGAASDQIVHNPKALGSAIRGLRQEKQLTVERLAERAGLSKGYVSLVESGKRTPHWSSVMKLVHALDDNLCRFLSHAQGVPSPEEQVRSGRKHLIVVHGNEPDRWGYVTDEESQGYIWILSSWFDGLRAEVVETCIPPHASLTPEAISFDANVTAFGLHGQLLLELGETSRNEFVMERGESLQFDARRPHRLRNFSDDVVKSLLVIAPPRF